MHRSHPALDVANATLSRLSSLPPTEALARVRAIRAELPSCGLPERLDALAGALPRRLAGLAPELSLELAELASALIPYAPTIPEDLNTLEPVVRLAWLRLALAVALDERAGGPEFIDEPTLLRVIEGWSSSEARDPLALVTRLASADDPRLRACVPEQLAAAVRDLTLSPEHAFRALVPLTTDPQLQIRRAAYQCLWRGWLQQLSPTSKAERKRLIQAGLADEDLTIVEICVALTTTFGQREWLVEIIDGPEHDDNRRAAALLGLGPLARREDLEVALTLAVSDPLRFSSCTRRLLLEAHRHGVFLDDALVELALEAFDSHHGWTGEALVRVTHIARSTLIDALGKLRAHDPRWRRRAAILAASVGTGAHRLLAELLVELREQGADPRTAAALIEAAGASPEYDAEGPLLAWLTELPELVIPVLRVKGGPSAAARLRALVQDPCCPAPLREPALDALWALSDERPELLVELSKSLGPRRSGLTQIKRRATRDAVGAKIYVEAPWGDDPAHALEPVEVLELLCESGERSLMAEVTRLFRVVYTGAVQQAVRGDFSHKRTYLPTIEQHIYRYGRHLIANGRSVRAWTAVEPQTGRDLVLALASDWLREGPPPPLRVALLETIARQEPSGPVLRFIEHFWRDRDTNVQRAAIEAILAAGEDARGLELSLCRLGESTDPRLVRQALIAIDSLDAKWAEPMVIAALRHPNMGIKQGAAAALSTIGSSRCVPAVVRWLGHHGNTHLRELLLAALDSAADSASLAVLVDALGDEGEPSAASERRQELLHQAISGRLTLAAAVRLAASGRGELVALVDAAVGGEVRLADGSADELASALYRAKLRPAPTHSDPARALRLHGFSPEAALALVDARRPEIDGRIFPVVRDHLAPWLSWLSASEVAHEPPLLGASQLLLEAATSGHSEHLDRLLALAESGRGPLGPELLTAFIERCVAHDGVELNLRTRALWLLRELPPAPAVRGLRRYRLLAKLGAVRRLDDLEACLAACRVGPDLVGDSRALLLEALAVPVKREREPEELAELRREIQDWHRRRTQDADTWLRTVCSRRPLDLPPLPEPSMPPAPPGWVPTSEADLRELMEGLGADEVRVRELAAKRLLAWPDAREAWPRVLDAYLAGELELDRRGRGTLARELEAWPAQPASTKAAHALFEHLDHAQRRRFLPGWIGAWGRGLPEAKLLLDRVEQGLLLPHARAHAEAGDYGLVRLLRADGSLALAELIEFVAERAPDEIEHLIGKDGEPAETSDEAERLHDPIGELELDGLVALIETEPVEQGLAVRAVHALAGFGERGADALEPLTLDRRPRIRSAALRALRKVAPRERCLTATARVLGMETRRDVILSLISSLAYGRHEPSAAALLEYTTHRDQKLRDAARDALRGWGPGIAATLRRASRRARPDRRRVYDELIAELE